MGYWGDLVESLKRDEENLGNELWHMMGWLMITVYGRCAMQLEESIKSLDIHQRRHATDMNATQEHIY